MSTLYLLVSSADNPFANSLDPDQDRQSGSKLYDTLMVLLKEFFEKDVFEKKQQNVGPNLILKKKSADDKKHAKLPRRQRVNKLHLTE